MSVSDGPSAADVVRREKERLRAVQDATGRRKQHPRGALTVRERLGLLLDDESFVEYGSLARPTTPDLEAPGDAVVTGTGLIDERPVVVIAFDYAFVAGTQGPMAHEKIDRVLELADARDIPVVILNEGGGSRAQEIDSFPNPRHAGTFVLLARLAARLPVACAVLGRAFAGNANLAGLSNFVVATRGAVLGIGGPPLVKAALGLDLNPEQIGPMDLHAATGTVDLVVEDDRAAIAAIVTYLGIVSGHRRPARDPRAEKPLDAVIPASARHAYDMHDVIANLLDAESALELRQAYAPSALTVLGRVAGKPIAVVANQPAVLAGSFLGDTADKIAHFIRLADTFDIPILFLVDTPGFMVGPDGERSALVRRSARVIHALAHATVPLYTVIVRKAYGLALYAMGYLAFRPTLVVAWPTAELAGMGASSAAGIAGRTILRPEDIDALKSSSRFAVDDVVQPNETRRLLIRAMANTPRAAPRPKPPLDPW